MWLRAKTKANLKLELKMKFVLNTCGKELGGKIKSSMKSIPRVDFKTSKSHALIRKLI